MRYYEPAGVQAVLGGLLDEPSMANGVLHHAHIPARAADFVPIPEWLDPRLRAGLERRGVTALYSHQAEAVAAVRDGNDVVVVTPTASGKSLCYLLPTLQALADDPTARALYLFPTKALGQDQVAELGELCRAAELEINASTYDGDTPNPIRSAIRSAGPGRRHQPGHAPRRDPAAPHQVVPAVRAAPDHRDRRAAHLPGPLRQPRGQRPAPPAADLRPLRIAPGDRLLLRHDREPRRARGAADGADAASWWTGTAPRPGERHILMVQPPLLDPATGRARLGPDPGHALGAAVPASRPPDARVRHVARGRGADAVEPARVTAARRRAARPGPRLPRRLPAHGAARGGTRPARRIDCSAS